MTPLTDTRPVSDALHGFHSLRVSDDVDSGCRVVRVEFPASYEDIDTMPPRRALTRAGFVLKTASRGVRDFVVVGKV